MVAEGATGRQGVGIDLIMGIHVKCRRGEELELAARRQKYILRGQEGRSVSLVAHAEAWALRVP